LASRIFYYLACSSSLRRSASYSARTRFSSAIRASSWRLSLSASSYAFLIRSYSAAAAAASSSFLFSAAAAASASILSFSAL